MHPPQLIQEALRSDGYYVLRDVFPKERIHHLNDFIENFGCDPTSPGKTADLFAIRRFMKVVPAAVPLIFNNGFIDLLTSVFGTGYFVSKSIYFDKPPRSNWFVAWHQDLTLSVDKKIEVAGYGPWTIKAEQFSVRPPLSVLADNFTVRIHLDDTDDKNGALKIIPGSHHAGILEPQQFAAYTDKACICSVPEGGVMFMKPLLLHASGRTLDSRRRRVIHIEFSKAMLPAGINWSEFMDLPE